MATFVKFFDKTKSPNAGFAFNPPDIFFIKGTEIPPIPTGLKIHGRPMMIVTNNKKTRLVGIGILKNYKYKKISIQFFRMDYDTGHPNGSDDGNYDVWTDNQFQFHIPKN